mmetsp:Transcript_32666/g.49987  ORF Transcript_32666/g.49987 Transcript_32666/m.49987 type:complete len:85 (-) Transcript_32666:255-509(-)
MRIGHCISSPFRIKPQQPFVVVIENIGMVDHALSHPRMVHQADSTTVSSLSMEQFKRKQQQQQQQQQQVENVTVETKITTRTWW